MSTQYPRSPKVQLGGIAHLGRIIDKIRLRHPAKFKTAVSSPKCKKCSMMLPKIERVRCEQLRGALEA